jgi:hypothetical protein
MLDPGMQAISQLTNRPLTMVDTDCNVRLSHDRCRRLESFHAGEILDQLGFFWEPNPREMGFVVLSLVAELQWLQCQDTEKGGGHSLGCRSDFCTCALLPDFSTLKKLGFFNAHCM